MIYVRARVAELHGGSPSIAPALVADALALAVLAACVLCRAAAEKQ